MTRTTTRTAITPRSVACATPDPHSRDIRCLVNGETPQASLNLVFDVSSQAERRSRALTLGPEGVVFTAGSAQR